MGTSHSVELIPEQDSPSAPGCKSVLTGSFDDLDPPVSAEAFLNELIEYLRPLCFFRHLTLSVSVIGALATSDRQGGVAACLLLGRLPIGVWRVSTSVFPRGRLADLV